MSVAYPVLTLSSENLADDEREDTSEGEVEPEPDYDLDECCGMTFDLRFLKFPKLQKKTTHPLTHTKTNNKSQQTKNC